jgi:hypothetical protein
LAGMSVRFIGWMNSVFPLSLLLLSDVPRAVTRANIQVSLLVFEPITEAFS